MEACNQVLNSASVFWERKGDNCENIGVFPNGSIEDWGNDGSVNLTSAVDKLLETKIKDKISIHI